MSQPSHQQQSDLLHRTLQNGLQSAQTTVGSVLSSLGLGSGSILKRGQAWEREFVGRSGELTFELQIKREKSGKLSGSYSVKTKAGQSGDRWPLTGELRPDDSFSLKGTQYSVQ